MTMWVWNNCCVAADEDRHTSDRSEVNPSKGSFSKCSFISKRICACTCKTRKESYHLDVSFGEIGLLPLSKWWSIQMNPHPGSTHHTDFEELRNDSGADHQSSETEKCGYFYLLCAQLCGHERDRSESWPESRGDAVHRGSRKWNGSNGWEHPGCR